jgi:hypothetical protein
LVRTSLELVTSIVLALIDGRKDDEGKKKWGLCLSIRGFVSDGHFKFCLRLFG